MQSRFNLSHRITLIIILILGLVGVVSAQDRVVLDTMPVLESGDIVSDTFNDEVSTHLYAFHASAGDIISIGMLQDSDELDPFLVLLDASGAVLAMDDDSGNQFLSAEISGFEIPDDGTYLILATSRLFIEGTESRLDDVEYRLSVVGNVPAADAARDEIELVVTVLDYGQIVQSESSEDAPAAFFVFQGSAGDIVDVLVNSDEFPTVLHVFDPEGARLAVDPSAISNLELPEDGIYLILATDVFFYEAMQEDTFFIGGVFVLSLDGA